MHKLLLAGLAASVAVAVASPAHAQALPVAGGASYSFSKAEAILGGSPSALQAILAQQSGRAVPAAVQPASLAIYRRAPVVPAILRDRPAVSPGVTNGRPDIFGSVALRVGRTPLDARWHRVEHSPVSGSAARYATGLRSKPAVERLEAVNWYVNKRVRFVDDSRQYGRADVWSAAGDTLARGRGDCEDFAIAKLAMLRRAGIAERDLYLVIVKDLVRRADHAVLVVRASGHMYVLDNGTDEVLDSESIADYRPVFTFASNSTFTHGYRIEQAPVSVASLDVDSSVPGLSGLR